MGKPESVFVTQEENIVPEIVKPVSRTDKPESVFVTQEENIVPEIVKPVDITNKPVSVFNQNEISQNQTSLADIT